MTTGGGPTVRRRQLMAELRRLREATRLTQEEVATQLDWHPTKVMRIETGRTAPHPNDVRVMLDLYGMTDADAIVGLIKLAKDARQRGWWYSYRDVLLNRYEFFIGLESEAATIRDFGLAMIPGLLQTEDYAREVSAMTPCVAEDEVNARVASRLARQQRVLLRDEPPAAWFLVDYFALLRQIGTPEVMAAQMRHLSALARLPYVTIQVVPGIAHAGLLGGFTVTDKAAYAESVMRGQVFEDEETRSALSLRFDTLRSSACSAPESIKLLRQAADLWSGVRRPTARRTGTA